MADLDSTREALAARQRGVLDDLLAGRLPDGFDARGTAMTTRVLHRKRSDAALRAAEELQFLPGWRQHFHAWAGEHPQAGCAHDDVLAFVDHLRQHTGASDDELAEWLRLHEVYDGVRRVAWVKIGGRHTLAVGIGNTVWRLACRTRTKGERSWAN
ncbi:hypothetical protein [Nocardioides speluncae]|uniref:hypothetical protein n=1 Tax=Nocardioides speluncae TaxID=2670337 RepID=UPI000D6909F1|nr:hypothetical protein [Nocardioides speluncae]